MNIGEDQLSECKRRAARLSTLSGIALATDAALRVEKTLARLGPILITLDNRPPEACDFLDALMRAEK